jgi:predicted ribosome quality control (RQC) complex YloA/Tae2 family protein
MEPLTAGVIVKLAFTKVFETTIEKFTESAIAKMEPLRQKIADKLRGNTKAENALAAAKKGSKQDLEKVAAYLQVVMNEEPDFAQEIQTIAREIEAGKLQDNSSMTQNNSHNHNSPGFQTRVDGGPTFIGGTSHHNNF